MNKKRVVLPRIGERVVTVKDGLYTHQRGPIYFSSVDVFKHKEFLHRKVSEEGVSERTFNDEPVLER